MSPMPRYGIDLTEISRVQRLLEGTGFSDLRQLFSDRELSDSGSGVDRSSRLAARLAAKEACMKLFPRETGLGILQPSDFSICKNGYGAPEIALSPKAQATLDLYGIASIGVSLSHTANYAMAIAIAHAKPPIQAPLLGKALFHLVPIRRNLILSNLQRVYGHTLSSHDIRAIAQAHYAHFFRLAQDFLRDQLLPWTRRADRVRVENLDVIIKCLSSGTGGIILTGHFGSFMAAISSGVTRHPEARGKFSFVRRPLKPQWFEALINSRFEKAGFSSLAKTGSMEAILDSLEQGNAIVFPFDQHTSGRGSIRVEFFGHQVGTFRSLALLALSSGAPVIPAASWREANGQHVLRFEEPLKLVQHPDAKEEIRLNTRLFNEALERMILRHPDQWWWVHRRFRS